MDAVKKFEEEGFSPIGRNDLPPYKMSIPFDWNVNPFKDNNWSFQIQTLRYLMIYKSAYDSTGDEGYVNSLIGWFYDWYEFNSKSPSSFAWHDMATGIRAEKIHQLAEAMKKAKIRAPAWFNSMIQEHVNVLRSKGFIRLNHNHGLYALHGLRCLAEHLGPGMKLNVLNYVNNCLSKLLENQFDDNYVHKEHSPHYHHLVLDSLKRYKKTSYYDQFEVLDEYIKGASDVAPNLYLPDGREIPFGDTDGEEVSVNDLNIKNSVESFWCGSGYAVYKKGMSYLCVTNSFNSGIHKHWDNLSFIYGVEGRDVLVDPGKYKYSDCSIRNGIISSISHNTISLKGVGFAGKNINKDSLFVSGGLNSRGVNIDSGMVLNIDGSVIDIKRRIELLGEELLIEDRCSGGGGKEFISTLVLHKACKILGRSSSSLDIGVDDISMSFSFNSDVESEMGESGQIFFLDEVPVSYGYGKYELCTAIRVRFRSGLNVVLSRL